MTLSKQWILLLIPVFYLVSCSSKSNDSGATLVGNWITLTSFNGNARSEAVSFTIGDKFYIGLGYDGINRLNDFWEFDGSTQLWRKVKTFPGGARSGAIGFGIGSKGYVGTGFDDNGNRLQDFYEYTPGLTPTDSGSWDQKNDFAGTARLDATSFTINDTGYIVGGYDGSYLKDFWKYDPNLDAWTEKAFPGNKRRDAVAFVIDGKAYLGTGVNNGTMVNDFWEFDPAGASTGWTQKRKISNATTESFDDEYNSIIRSNAAAFVIDNKGYIATGENGVNIPDVWEYTPATDVWVKKTSFEGFARTGAVGYAISDQGYILTGRSGSTPFDDLWQFFPDAAVVSGD